MKIKLEQLQQNLNNKLAPVYLISGDEYLLVQETCDVIRSAAAAAGFTERIILSVEKNFDWQELAIKASNISLFSEQNLLELRLNTSPGTTGANTLIAYMQKPPEDKILLIITEKLDASQQKTKWFKAIDSRGIVIQVWPLDITKLPQWITQRMRQKGLTTTAEGINLLAEFVEGNLLAATQEIEKLHLLYGIGQLTVQQIAASIADNARFNVFDLADSILKNERGKTIRILRNLQAEKIEPVLILWAISKEIRSLASMRSLIEQGDSAEMVMQKYHVWAKRKSFIKNTLQKYKSDYLHKIMQSCAQIDRIIKGAEPGNSWDEMEKLCARLGK